MTTPINGHRAAPDVAAFSIEAADAAQQLAELDSAEQTAAAPAAPDGGDDQEAGTVADTGAEAGRGPSQATMLRRLALGRYRFGCAPDGTPFAVPLVGPRVARSLRGGKTSMRAELAKLYARAYGGNVPSASALADALTALEGEASEFDAEPLALRVAEHAGALLLDLGRADGRVVQVTPGGWSVLGTSPVLFRRTALTGALPDPSRPGDLAPLRERLNVSDADWSLVLAWLCAALTPSPPHPLLALLGEQGTGKSTATRLVVEVIDPSPVPLRPAPRDEDQWSVAAASSWVVGLDNLSGVAPWFSDSLCRAVTGAGSIRRRLYTDDDVAVLAFRRAVVANGIDFGDLRGDLADRMLAVELNVIGDDQRREEADIAMRADEHAAVLGGLLDLAVEVLAVFPGVRLDRMPRMADFARIVAAVDQVRGTDSLARYLSQRGQLAETVVEGDQFATEIRHLADANQRWTGTSGELLAALTTSEQRRPKPWPATERAASAALSRVAPALRQLGYTVTRDREAGTGRRLWTLLAPGADPTSEESRQTPSRPSQPSRQGTDQQKLRDGWDDVTVTPIPTTVTPEQAARLGVTVGPDGVTVATSQPSHPDTGTDQGEHSGRDGRDGCDGQNRLSSDVPCQCGAATHRPRDLGACIGCGALTHRYGDGGNAHCPNCRQNGASA